MRYITMLLLTFSLAFNVMAADEQVTPQTGYKMVNGVNHFYKIIGKGEPIVILHGGPGMFHDYFLPHLELLAEDFQLIFYDQRGNGGSKAELTPANFTIAQLTADLEGMRQAFGIEKMNLLGHSWGGLLAMYYAIDYPQHLKSLILSNPAPADSDNFQQMLISKNGRYTPEMAATIGEIMQSGAIEKGDVMAFKKLINLVEGVNTYQPEKIEKLLGNMQYTTEKMTNALMISQLKNSFFEKYDIRSQLSKVTVKTLVIHGDADTIPLASDQSIVKSLVNAKLQRFSRSGHYPYAEQPVEFVQAVKQFVSQ